jgi:hypothetical protein
LGFKNCPAGMVLRGNKIYAGCLPLGFQSQDSSYFTVALR